MEPFFLSRPSKNCNNPMEMDRVLQLLKDICNQSFVVPTETSSYFPQVFGQDEMFDVGSHCSQQISDFQVVSY